MITVGIDPGSKESAVVVFDTDEMRLLRYEHMQNERVAWFCGNEICGPADAVVIETPAPGAVWGHDLNETLWWAGRFYEAHMWIGPEPRRITRTEVKKQLLGRVHGNDAQVNAVVKMMVAQHHGIAEKEVKGRVKSPGPCFGLKSHGWAALAAVLADRVRGRQ